MTPTPLPTSWFEVEPLTGNDDDVRAVLRDPSHPLVEAVRRTSAREGAVLAGGLRSALGAHRLFSYPREQDALHAATMMAVWLGLGPAAVHEDLGGTVTIVRSGLGHRDDQKWHTDSTPWRRPNRLTLLGQVHLAAGFTAPATELLPLRTVEEALTARPDSLQALRSAPVPWRRNFPDRAQFDAPVLAIDPPRWVGAVLEQCFDDLPVEQQNAIEVFRATVDALVPVRATVEPGRLLIFDNHANLHRGPGIEQDLERRLVRIKLGGLPE